ncbi:MAG: biotin-dependent carboxyltransferase family protein [Armatimonadota bacterium]|nr:biotin-dependent carboxyltransferase family protein [Armatimonadota bacterium]
MFRVQTPGLLSTLQDLGRVGYQNTGMPVAGAMDPFALQVANLLVGNARGAAALELTLLGPTLEVLGDVTIAVCGADLSARLDDAPLPLWRTAALRAGQTLRWGRRVSGARAYLAVAGGLDVPEALGSRSTFLRAGIGGFAGRALRAGDVLRGEGATAVQSGRALAPSAVPIYSSSATVRVVSGPHEDAFAPATLATFFTSEYMLSAQSDRMGYRLDGPSLSCRSERQGVLLSEAVPWGGVQIPPDGQPILLMADRQTTGGYPLIAVVATADRPRCAQLAPGDSVSFQPISLEEAQEADAAQERLLALLGSVQ